MYKILIQYFPLGRILLSVQTPTCAAIGWLCAPLAYRRPIPPLIRETWDSFLANYPDREFVSGLLNIIDVGASIGHSGPPISQSCKNLRSAIDHPDIISKEINSLLSEGRIHGPFVEPPLPNFRCSPLGTATR